LGNAIAYQAFSSSGVQLRLLKTRVLTFGNWFMPYAPPDSKVFDRKFVGWQDLYELHGTITYIRDRYSLRGVHDPISKVDIRDRRRFHDITEGQTCQSSTTAMWVDNAMRSIPALATTRPVSI
jgi:hypothetical protein